MGELGNVNFVVFNAQQIRNYNKTQIKTEIINKLPKQHANFKEQIKPYIEEYLNNDTLDKFFTDTLKTPITKIYSSHNFYVKKVIGLFETQNNTKIENILETIVDSAVFKLNLTSDIKLEITDVNLNTPIIDNIHIIDNLAINNSPFITALKKYILNLINLLKLLQDNENNIKNIYALVNNQRIKDRDRTKTSNHKLLPEKRNIFRSKDTNVTAKQLENIEEDNTRRITKVKNSLIHSANDITLNNLKTQLILFQTAYEDIKNFIKGGVINKYTINDIKTYIDGIQESQTELINSLQDINNNFNYSVVIPHNIFASKIEIETEKNLYKKILKLLSDITTNKELLKQINNSNKNIKIYLDHHYADVKVIDLVEETRNSEIDKQIKAFNNSQFSTSALSTLSTSLDKVQSKGLDYLDTVIKIIIFLIFLNLFITTYFYFTTSIEATANRSNCGGASLCEAETHRHLFLEDNGNDKARDIYIIIVVIFSIYLLSEIFKNSKDGINFTDTDTEINYIKQSIIFVCFFGSMLLAQFAKYYFDKYKDQKDFRENIKSLPMHVFIIAYSVSSFIAILGCFVIAYRYGPSSIYIKIIMGFIVSISLGYDIHNFINNFINKSTSDSFESKSFESKSFNSKFKAKTAIDILLITFYSISIVVLFVLRDVNNITIPIVALSLLAVLMATLYIFILNSSVDWSRYANNDDYNRYFEIFHRSIFVISGIFPGLLALMFNSKQNIIKLIVFYYAILFIIYLFYVYFINHNNESGILSLAYFQLYNYLNIQKNENTKGSDNTVYKFTTEGETNDETKNYYKQFNQINVYFVVVLLIILIVIGGLNDDPNLDNIIYGIIVFIIASYITGIVYLLYSKVFPIQQASFNYKKNLVDINNEISQHIKVKTEEHTIDINKIRIFKIANNFADIRKIHEKIDSERGDGTKDKEKHMKNIRDIFSEISPKGSSYEDYRSQSIHQMQYEEYIYRLFSVWTNTDFKFQPNFAETIFGDDDFEKNLVETTYRSNSYILYNSIILKLPKNKAKLLQYIQERIDISKLIAPNSVSNTFIQEVFNIPKTNNIEYVIKKNYKYVTGEEGEIQKYNVLSDKELSCLYYSSNNTRSTNDDDDNNKLLTTSIKKSIKNYDNTKFKITNIATYTGVKNDDFPIYKLNQDIFDDFKISYNSKSDDLSFTFELGNEFYSNILSHEVKEDEKLNPAFYTIGYDYENYTYKEEDHQQMNKDTAYSIPARYYACSYLNYFPNEDGSMSKVKFAKNIKEDNYNPLNTKGTIIDRIAKSYNANAEATKIELAPEKFHFLLVFLVILAIIILMFLFNIIKKYFTGDVYTPQMYVLGILGVFLTTFIFGEVIFARLK